MDIYYIVRANLFDIDEKSGDVVSLDDALAYLKGITSFSQNGSPHESVRLYR